MTAKLGGGNVGISRFLRDFQGAVESVENLFLVFHAFHGPGISTAPVRRTSAATVSGIAEATWPWPRSSGERIRFR